MAGKEENFEFSTKSKSSVFNRSLTIQSSFSKKPYISETLDGSSYSAKKWFDSFESAGNSLKGKVKQLRNLFESPKYRNYDHVSQIASQSLPKLRPAKSLSYDYKDSWSILDASSIQLPGTEDRVVIYFTSLRGIRRTYEDCYAVRMIFRGHKVNVDERDISMDSAYRKELQSVMGEKNNVGLPQVFIKGRYAGAADLIKQLNETGELRRLLAGMPFRERRFVCECCGDVRFVPCSNCSGSRKVFDEDEGIMKRCLICNENGLIRCPECCS